jgi:hypothetical protein
MPTYDIQIVETGEEQEVFVSYPTLKEKVDSGEWIQKHKATASIVSDAGSTLSKTSGDWKDLVKKIKKGSGRGNSIHT